MNDKVKLIIEIPKNYLETIKHTVRNTAENGNTPLALEIIANGIPLDDVKAEMEKLAEPYKEYRYANTYISLCIKIIDKYIGKAESEGK